MTVRAVGVASGIAAMAVAAGCALLAGFVAVLLLAVPVEPVEHGVIGEVAASAGAAAPIGQGGGGWVMPTGKPPAAERVIEVVDRISPASWKVGAAVAWIDKRTASRAKMVAKCSGKAYRCIIVKSGRIAGSETGWSQGATITIDTGKAKARGYGAKQRHWLLAHELGHQYGLTHRSGANLMNPDAGHWSMKLTSAQRAHLKKR